MAKPTLSMKPTGWFQVAWSAEIGNGDVHRMRYFDPRWSRGAASGQVAVMDAYCEHLGAHLGFGGTSRASLQCPFHGWEWDRDGHNVRIPYEKNPNRGRRMRTYPVMEHNESVYIWYDAESRDPDFEVPDVFSGFNDGRSAADYYPMMTL